VLLILYSALVTALAALLFYLLIDRAVTMSYQNQEINQNQKTINTAQRIIFEQWENSSKNKLILFLSKIKNSDDNFFEKENENYVHFNGFTFFFKDDKLISVNQEPPGDK
jgi:hypothetical protein